MDKHRVFVNRENYSGLIGFHLLCKSFRTRWFRARIGRRGNIPTRRREENTTNLHCCHRLNQLCRFLFFHAKTRKKALQIAQLV